MRRITQSSVGYPGRTCWGARSGEWELYNLKEDRTELNDLSGKHSELKNYLIQQFEKFAIETNVEDWEVIQRELGHIKDETVG